MASVETSSPDASCGGLRLWQTSASTVLVKYPKLLIMMPSCVIGSDYKLNFKDNNLGAYILHGRLVHYKLLLMNCPLINLRIRTVLFFSCFGKHHFQCFAYAGRDEKIRR